MDDPHFEARVAETEAALRAACEEAGILVTADGRISEAAAGELLGYRQGTMRNLREALTGPAAFARGVGAGGRWSYRLTDLAAWIEAARVEPDF